MLQSIYEDIMDLSEGGKSKEGLFLQIASIAKRLEFDYCAYGFRSALPISRPQVLMLNNYPPNWQNRYAEKNYLEVDPVVHHCTQYSTPLCWSANETWQNEAFREEASQFGIKHGWSISSWNPRGACGALTVARNGQCITQTELKGKEGMLILLAQAVHGLLGDLLTKQTAPELAVKLSPRELEIMRWSAEGKTASDIAQILSLTERTINFHVNNCVEKLSAANKTHAAIRLAMLGFLR